MKCKVNFHTHTYRCKHAIGSEKDYVIEAINKNLTTLGFSDHGPYPDDRFGYRMEYSELKNYIQTIQSLKFNYRDKINILTGLEIEYDNTMNNYYEYLLNELKLDYLALGQHIYSYNNELVNVFSLDSTDQYIQYAKSINEALSTSYFKFLAHPDVIFINNFPWDNNCEKACDIIINAAIKNNTILEFNANGIRRGTEIYPDGIRHPYPHFNFWSKVAKTNLRVIINSDCHNPKDIWDNSMDKAYDFAKSLGLNITYKL